MTREPHSKRERFDFLIAGVQKGGTTALHHFLSSHPGIGMPARKELHFFDDESMNWSSPDYSRLAGILEDADAGQIVGEATPIYSYWAPAAGRICRYNPAMKLIVLLRDPVERAFSHWSMEFARKKDDLDFSTAIRDGRGRLAGALHRTYSYVERGFYAEQVARLRSFFPPEQLLYVRTEDLREEHSMTLDRICGFLGVERFARYPDAAFILPRERVPVPAASGEDLDHLRRLYAPDIAETASLTGLDLSAWMRL